MYIEKRENKVKQEITLSILGVFDKESISICDKLIKECIDSSEWEKIIIDFNKTYDIDIEAVKLMWKVKDIANSKQKALEFKNANGKVAVAFKLLGFAEKFNIDVQIDGNIINKVNMLGEYEEPLYESRIINQDIFFETKIISLDVICDFVNETNKKFKVNLTNWCVIPDKVKNKLIFLFETKNIYDVEKSEEYLRSLVIDEYELDCSMYILENGTFAEYYEKKKQLGIPSKAIVLSKVIRNPYTQQYFLGKIDERY